MAKQTFTTGQVLTAAQMASLQQTAMGGGSTTAKTASYVLVAADAGTVVQMNSASATTITVNTALFAAGDTVKIMNIGAGVCTVTAGTATVSTAGSLALPQFDGGDLYFNSASAALFFDIVQGAGMTNPLTTTGDTIFSSSGTTPARLGIGSTGQVLTVAAGLPAWQTAAGGGGMTLLSTTTLGGSSTTISSISGSYETLYISILNVGFSTTGLQLRISPNADNVNSFGNAVVGVSGTVTNNQLQYERILTQGTGMDNTNALSLTIDNYASASSYKPIAYYGILNNSTGTTYNYFGAWGNNAALTSLVFSPSSGTFTAGTVKIYGVK